MPALHVTVIGGGYIGLEAAAVLRKLDKAVTLLEAGERVLARVAGEALSRFYGAEHRRQDVDLRTGTTIDAVTVEDGAVTAIPPAGSDDQAKTLIVDLCSLDAALLSDPATPLSAVRQAALHIEERP